MKDLTPITRKEKILNGEELEPITRLEYFLQKAVEGGGGSGGGLPAYTSADAGKVLTLAQGTEEVVVVPEQTLVLSSVYTPIVGVNIDMNNPPETLMAHAEVPALDVNLDGALTQVTSEEYFGYASEYVGGLRLVMLYIDDAWVMPKPQGIDDLSLNISATAEIPSFAEAKWVSATINLPELPAVDGAYALVISGGIASWIDTSN